MPRGVYVRKAKETIKTNAQEEPKSTTVEAQNPDAQVKPVGTEVLDLRNQLHDIEDIPKTKEECDALVQGPIAIKTQDIKNVHEFLTKGTKFTDITFIVNDDDPEKYDVIRDIQKRNIYVSDIHGTKRLLEYSTICYSDKPKDSDLFKGLVNGFHKPLTFQNVFGTFLGPIRIHILGTISSNDLANKIADLVSRDITEYSDNQIRFSVAVSSEKSTQLRVI
jgi:hypothetical protein